MSGGTHHRTELSSARARGHDSDLHDLVAWRPEEGAFSAAPPIAVSNVVPFARQRRDASAAQHPADAILPDPAIRPPPLAKDGRVRFLAVLALSLMVHGGIFLLFNREPEPMASIGLEAISVEIVLGANMPSGVATRLDEAKPVETAAAVATETPPERTEPQQRMAAVPLDTTPAPREPELTATPAEPVPEQMAVLAPPQPREADPAKAEDVPVQAVPEPRRTPPQKQEPKPQRETKPKTDRQPKAKQDRPARTASTEPTATGPRANAASGVGPGRSQTDTNYHGLVAAHLHRYKRFPPDAQARGDQGTATVSFSLDGGGRVTRVSLNRGTGFAALDQEVQGMVRRASPFPAPPDGRGQSFTVPVSFRVR